MGDLKKLREMENEKCHARGKENAFENRGEKACKVKNFKCVGKK